MKYPAPQIFLGALLGLLILLAIGLGLEFFGPQQRQPVVTGEALVGGPFALVDTGGNPVSDSDFSGRYMLIYFGYTYCPDVCPLALQKMAMALDLLEGDGVDLAALQPIFITVDPARDTPAVMGQYVKAFHPALIGLTGSPEAIAAAARAYRVYYTKAEDESPGAGAYLMDHSSVIYLMGPDGRYAAHFTSLATPEEMARRLKQILH